MSVKLDWLNEEDGIQLKDYFGDEGEEYYTSLMNLIKTIAPFLNKHQYYLPVGYTPHDFNHHIKQVFKLAWELTEKLRQGNKENYYCFLAAVVLHDLDMAYNPYGRSIHQLKSSDAISEGFEEELFSIFSEDDTSLLDAITQEKIDSDTNFEIIESIKEKLSNAISILNIPEEEYRDIISWIIFGHSDIKLRNGMKIRTLDKYIFDKAGMSKKILALSAYLRLADELDISYKRCDGINIVVPDESKEYWERLKVVRRVDITDDSILIIPKLNRTNINDNHVVELLVKIQEKIEKELKIVQDVIISCGMAFSISKVKVCFDSSDKLSRLFSDKKKTNLF